MNLNDDLFKKVEKKTSVNKDLILSLAEKLQNGNMKNEDTIRDVISTLSMATGKKVSKDQADKIVKKILKNEVPKNVGDMF